MAVSYKLARRICEVQPSATLAVDSKAKALQAQGKDIIGYGVGEPDFNTPEHICEAACKAIKSGDTKYAAKRGAELKKAIVEKLKRENNLEYKPEDIVVSNGAKQSLYNILQVVVDEGDEVIIPAPYWVSYLEQVRLAGGKPVILSTDEKTAFKITAEQLRKAITPHTRLFMHNSPSNPTGTVYTPAEISALGAVLQETGVLAISDEIYEHLIYGDIQPLSLAAVDGLKNQVFTVNGCSKSFSMTGWRIGWAAGPAEIMKAISKFQGHATSDPAAFSQAGAAEAYVKTETSNAAVASMKAQFDARRKLMHARLNKLNGVKCLEPLGAFYCFPNVSGVFGRTINGVTVKTPMDFCAVALEQAGVAVVPGEAFGSSQHVRLSYATSMELIEKGLGRLEKLLNA
ncbi:MAG TPA: pyridoxal phosphate-dependent aminotransferase [Planctomycetota bacterium]|nr:pyridoxal phosphate-dependent aminotransferase [Planctomycetota bacterium]